MLLKIHQGDQSLAYSAAMAGAERLRKALAEKGRASLIVAAGECQLDVLAALSREPDIRWDKITCFHLSEKVGLPITHPASHRRQLWEHFVSRLPLPLAGFHYVNGEAPDPYVECRRLGSIIHYHRIDVAFVGIGENAELAFNHPPADFQTEEPYLVVNLDPSESAPEQAICMSVQQILKSRSIVCSVPDEQKAAVVKAVVEGPLSNRVPASILQTHEDCTIYLDVASASQLQRNIR